jgi:hypothetical protein
VAYLTCRLHTWKLPLIVLCVFDQHRVSTSSLFDLAISARLDNGLSLVD